MRTSLLQCVSRTSMPILIPFGYTYVYRQRTNTFAYSGWNVGKTELWRICVLSLSGALISLLSLPFSLSLFLLLFLSGSTPQWGQLAQLEHFHLMGHSQRARFQAFYTFQRFLPLFICNLRQITRTTYTFLPFPSCPHPLRLLTGLWSAQIAPGSSECCLF